MSRFQKRGFTIVELVIVTVIIGILATVVIVAYGNITKSAKDKTLLADIDTVDGLETQYGINNNVSGKAWYSGSGVDPDLKFTPSKGNVIDVAIDSADYCIRAYNPAATKNSITNTFSKESSTGACARITVSVIANAVGSLVAPSGLRGQGYSGPAKIDVSWTAISGVTAYNIEYATDSGFSSPTKIDGVSGNSQTLTGLTAGQTYYIRVSSVLSGTVSAPSAPITVAATSDYGSLATGTSIEGYWTSAPDGFLIEDGSAVSRAKYPDLYAVIGTTYGAGDGSTTFNLPDSRGRASVDLSPSDTEFDSMGEKYGTKTETLTIAQMPSHTHIQNPHTHVQDPHTPSITDPGHNHTQNAHNHTQNAHDHNNGASNPYVSDGSFGSVNVFAANGSDYGYRYGGAQPSATATNQNTTATNNASTTGITVNSVTATNQSTTATNQNTGGGGSHNNIQPSIVKVFAIKYATPDSAAATYAEGTSINGYWTSAPTDYLLEDGSAVSRTTYAALFAVIGTTYGAGNGSTTFNLPDSRGRVSVNRSASDAEFDTIGEKSGEKAHTLTIAEMPSHTHIQNPHTHVQNAHTHTITDPGHNHTQNPHTHIQNAHNHNGGYANPYVNDGSFGGLSTPTLGGGYYGFKLGTSASTVATNNPTTATNQAATTGVGLYATTATNQATTATNQSTGGDAPHNEIQPSIVRLSAIKATPAVTTGTNVASGTSISGYWSAAPSGYLLEDGSAVSRTTYASLFAAIGTTYGAGDGSSTFNLPNSRGRVSVNRNPTDTEFDTVGATYGTKTETLTIAQMPSHTHIQDPHTHIQDPHTHSVYDPGHNHLQDPHTHTQNPHTHGSGYLNDGSLGGTLAFSATGGSYGFKLAQQPSVVATNQSTTATNNASTTGITVNATTATNQSTTAVNQNTGGGGPHNNIQPSIVKVFAIKI